MSGRPVRSLESLAQSASTSRVLNLRAIGMRYRRDPDYAARPLFSNVSLNKSIILKHRLRPHERDEFHGYRSLATKILLPIENADLRMGARYLFVGQRNFEQLLSQTFGIESDGSDRDARILTLLDETPTLDPFLLREQLKLNGFDIAPCYFDISQADMKRMFAFAQTEIQQLVEMSFGEDGSDLIASGPVKSHVGKLARKILMNANDADLEPLRLTMQLTPKQYQEGMFCWKAFLYYKWRLNDVLPDLKPVISHIDRISPRGVVTPEIQAFLESSRVAIRRTMAESCHRVTDTLAIYDEAYEGMTKKGDPLRFRDFLRKAPSLFTELGERLGAIDHVISFWRFRFPSTERALITPEELSDIFSDFQQSLSITVRSQAA